MMTIFLQLPLDSRMNPKADLSLNGPLVYVETYKYGRQQLFTATTGCRGSHSKRMYRV